MISLKLLQFQTLYDAVVLLCFLSPPPPSRFTFLFSPYLSIYVILYVFFILINFVFGSFFFLIVFYRRCWLRKSKILFVNVTVRWLLYMPQIKYFVYVTLRYILLRYDSRKVTSCNRKSKIKWNQKLHNNKKNIKKLMRLFENISILQVHLQARPGQARPRYVL